MHTHTLLSEGGGGRGNKYDILFENLQFISFVTVFLILEKRTYVFTDIFEL